MALDMNGLLPGAEGMSRKKQNKKRRGCLWFFIFVIIIAVAGYYYPQRRENLLSKVSGWFKSGGDENIINEPVAAENNEAVETQNSEGNKVLPLVVTPQDIPESVRTDKTDEVAGQGKDVISNDENSTMEVVESTDIMSLWKKVESLSKSGETARVNELLGKIYEENPTNEHGANALLRLGLNARKAGDEVEAQKYWRNAYLKTPETIGGRLSSLMLADIWYNQYVVADVPQYDKWEAVRDAYSNTLGFDESSFLSDALRKKIISRLNKLNSQVVFSRRECSGSEYYVVKPNDRLEAIAQKFGVHFDGIALINSIKRPQYYIRVGEKLKILKVPAKVIVDKSDMTLTLYLGGKWIKQYPICHGGARTPLGEYTVVTKSANPSWTDPITKQVFPSTSKRNILGARWLGFGGEGPGEGIGIHGTTLPHTIPGDSSNGCVRMLNENVEEIYGLVLIGTTVIIRP